MNNLLLHPKLSCSIGVDVGGTKIAAGLVDAQGNVLQKRVIPTNPKRGGEAVLQDSLALAELLLKEAHNRKWNVTALGVGVCELVDTRGRVVSRHTLPWQGLPVQERFSRLAPAIVEADSRAAAFCEARCGAGRGLNSFFYVTVGTGIGSSLVLDGLPFMSTNGCTGELASAPMSVLNPESDTITCAVLEKTASGPALVTRYNQRAGARLSRAEEVLSAFVAGDAIACSIVETAAICLGSAIALIVNVMAPEAVIIGGGLGSAPGPFWECLGPAIRNHVWSEITRDLPICQAAHNADAGFIGAALLAVERLKTK